MLLQVLERVKDPLQTLVSRDQYETAYAVLAHFLLIAQRAPILFSQVQLTGPDHLLLDCTSACTSLWAAAAQAGFGQPKTAPYHQSQLLP